MSARRTSKVVKSSPSKVQQSERPQGLGRDDQRRSDVGRRTGTPSLEIYDTTLRDGAQAEDVSFSVDDKVLIVQKLDDLGVHYIEGGWPGANPKDIEFFRIMKTTPLTHAKVVAFGSTRKASNRVQKDPNIEALLRAETDTITLFGKSWGLHVTDALGITLAKNLEIIGDSIAYLRSKGRQVFYDAE
ncbi:MAG: hypothetical protein ACREIS_08350, partial [Nitrospiraceae bacterium]